MNEDRRLVDFHGLAGRLRSTGVALAIAALAGAFVQTLLTGWDGSVVVTWVSVFVAAVVFATAAIVGWSAAQGANTAQQRGERLSSEDVGWIPPRRRSS